MSKNIRIWYTSNTKLNESALNNENISEIVELYPWDSNAIHKIRAEVLNGLGLQKLVMWILKK